MKKSLLILLSLIAIISCAQNEKRGYSFELSDYDLLKEGLNDKNDVINYMGNPSLINNEGDKTQELWIYYSEDTEKFLFFKPTILDRKIITINFDKNDKINKIKNYGLSDENKIAFDSSYTKVESPKKGWWSEIFGNIGQVKATN